MNQASILFIVGIITLALSLIANYLIIKFQHIHGHISADSDILGPQKFHKTPVPRIGGIAIFLSFAIGILLQWRYATNSNFGIVFLISLLPAFISGATEDITKKISAKSRMVMIIFSSLIAQAYLDITIVKIDVPFFDQILKNHIIAIAFTTFAISGLTNAYNIVDGFNGLASAIALLAIGAISFLSINFGDYELVIIGLVLLLSLLGFFFWNYPNGKIFLGDGGAYFTGLAIGILSIILVKRNPSISPWFVVLINIYPIYETLFSIFRRTFLHRSNALMPDGLHLHSLIFRRIVNKETFKKWGMPSNSATSLPFILLSLICDLLAVVFYSSTHILVCIITLVCIIYFFLFLMLIKSPFKKSFRMRK